jgi:hypothetical protein
MQFTRKLENPQASSGPWGGNRRSTSSRLLTNVSAERSGKEGPGEKVLEVIDELSAPCILKYGIM